MADPGASVPAHKMRRGPADPGRRVRIAHAAIAVAAERGVAAVTHRAVAAAAKVPLGSTTYHFTSLDDLLQAAMDEVCRREVERLHAWADGLPDDVDVAIAWADLLLDHIGEPDRVVLRELRGAALHRPGLRSCLGVLDHVLIDVLRSRTDPVAGVALAALFDGLAARATVDEQPPSRHLLVDLARRVLYGRWCTASPSGGSRTASPMWMERTNSS